MICVINGFIFGLVSACLAGSDLDFGVPHLTVMLPWKLYSEDKCRMLLCNICFLGTHLVLWSWVVRQVLDLCDSNGIKDWWKSEGTTALYIK